MELQMEVLRPQLDLALEYQRPVSLHCVAAHGTLLQVLQEVFGRGHGPGLVYLMAKRLDHGWIMRSLVSPWK